MGTNQTGPVVVAGGSLAACLYVVIRSSTGFLEAAAFMLALVVTALTLGIVIAESLERGLRGKAMKTEAVNKGFCSTCYQRMQDTHGFWVCPRCDTAPSHV